MLQDESETLERINQTNEMQKKIFENFEKNLLYVNGNEYINNNDKLLINEDNKIIDDENDILENNHFEEKKNI